MSHASDARPQLWFLSPPAPTRWRAFMAYFADRGYGCSTRPMTDVSTAAHGLANPPAAGIVVIAWRRFPPTALPGPALRGWALLAPSGWHLMRLGRQAPSVPGWIGLGSRQGPAVRLMARRLRSSPHLTVHTFDGLGADLPFALGWERVAYALRRWLEREVPRGA